MEEEKGKALARLMNKYLGEEIVEQIRAETPKELVWDRPGRGVAKFRYVPGFHFIQRMNELFGFAWSSDVDNWIIEKDQIVVKGHIEVHVPGTTIERTYPDGMKETIRIDSLNIRKGQFGSSQIKRWTSSGKDHKSGDMIDLGDDLKGAATDMMKKSCSQLGLFWDVYSNNEKDTQNKANDVQLITLFERAEELGWNEEKTDTWIEEQTGKTSDELTPDQASELISILIKLKEEQRNGTEDLSGVS